MPDGSSFILKNDLDAEPKPVGELPAKQALIAEPISSTSKNTIADEATEQVGLSEQLSRHVSVTSSNINIIDSERKSNTEFSMRSEVEKPWDEMTPEERTATINATMTMQQAKAMIDKAYTAGGIRDWYEEYRNADQWLRGEGSAEVAMYIENEYELQRKYINCDNWASLVLKFRLIFTVCGS